MDENANSRKRAGDTNSKGQILLLFDVDGTLTPSRLSIGDKMDEYLRYLRTKYTVGLVGGSDINKISEQVLNAEEKSSKVDSVQQCVRKFDYVFAENGLVAFKGGEPFAKRSLVDHLGERDVQRFINFCLGYMSQLELPVKRGNFIEFRTGLINVCPVGRSCSQEEREAFNKYDREHGIRRKFVDALESKFGPASEDPLDLVYAIGGQISFDAFPKGWDKTFCLNYVAGQFEKIYFFGDKCSPGGNDYEIYADQRTLSYAVKDPSETLTTLMKLDETRFGVEA